MVLVQEKVAWLQITMNQAMIMNKSKSQHDSHNNNCNSSCILKLRRRRVDSAQDIMK